MVMLVAAWLLTSLAAGCWELKDWAFSGFFLAAGFWELKDWSFSGSFGGVVGGGVSGSDCEEREIIKLVSCNWRYWVIQSNTMHWNSSQVLITGLDKKRNGHVLMVHKGNVQFSFPVLCQSLNWLQFSKCVHFIQNRLPISCRAAHRRQDTKEDWLDRQRLWTENT